ncbi:MAG: hypothetical protein H7329_05950 [Opitutaceae bacterium]|nr:hypothetical protein [Cytophagales bacterium]
MLRIPVKINGVNNLSDARYCAGMGVEMMGYSVSENHERYIPVEKINGISGWISGIKIIAESYLGEDSETIIQRAENIAAQAIEIEAGFYSLEIFKGKNLICRVEMNELNRVLPKIPAESVLHLKIKKSDVKELLEIAKICAERETILNVSELDLNEIELILKETKLYGLSLDGGNELSPGLRDFEDLANVLEYLEA